MFRPRILKPLLMIFALVLASYVSGHAQGVRQEPIRAEGGEGNQQDVQTTPNFPQHPHAIICAIPGHDPRPILVPDGRNPTDFCPASLTTARIYTNYPVPIVSGVLPPPLSDEDTGGGH